MNEEEWEATYWQGLWLEGYLQKVWQAVPAPAVIEPTLKKNALAQIAPECIAALPPVDTERLTDSVYRRQSIAQIEAYWQGVDGEQYGLRYSAYYLPQWKTEVQIELRTGAWTYRENGSRPAPIEVLYLGEQICWMRQYCREHGHYPGIKPCLLYTSAAAARGGRAVLSCAAASSTAMWNFAAYVRIIPASGIRRTMLMILFCPRAMCAEIWRFCKKKDWTAIERCWMKKWSCSNFCWPITTMVDAKRFSVQPSICCRWRMVGR